jgi:hypothetical protein
MSIHMEQVCSSWSHFCKFWGVLREFKFGLKSAEKRHTLCVDVCMFCCLGYLHYHGCLCYQGQPCLYGCLCYQGQPCFYVCCVYLGTVVAIITYITIDFVVIMFTLVTKLLSPHLWLGLSSCLFLSGIVTKTSCAFLLFAVYTRGLYLQWSKCT